jgi:hypothetical protein
MDWRRSLTIGARRVGKALEAEMNHDVESEVDAQRLLPDDPRRKRLVIDRFGGCHLFFAEMLLGGGVALTVASDVLDDASLRWGFPVALACMYVLRTIRAPAERRLPSELRGRVEAR